MTIDYSKKVTSDNQWEGGHDAPKNDDAIYEQPHTMTFALTRTNLRVQICNVMPV